MVKRGHLHQIIPLGTLDKLEGIYPKQELGFAGHERQLRRGKRKWSQVKAEGSKLPSCKAEPPTASTQQPPKNGIAWEGERH